MGDWGREGLEEGGRLREGGGGETEGGRGKTEGGRGGGEDWGRGGRLREGYVRRIRVKKRYEEQYYNNQR